MAKLIIQVCPREPAVTACLMNGLEVREDPEVFDALADCNRGGDVEPACDYVRSEIGVEFRIVALNSAGKYENRLATDAEKEATARAIYFESESDFADPHTCENFLIWEAARVVEED